MTGLPPNYELIAHCNFLKRAENVFLVLSVLTNDIFSYSSSEALTSDEYVECLHIHSYSITADSFIITVSYSSASKHCFITSFFPFVFKPNV